jgi:hypothetical protein
MLVAHQVASQGRMTMDLSSLSFSVLGGESILLSIPLLPLFGVIQLSLSCAACECKTSFVCETERQLPPQTARVMAFTSKLNMDFPPDHN